MAAQSLLNAQVDLGRNTLVALDGAGLDIRAAYWLFDEDGQAWRFTIAEPTVDISGTHAVYERMAGPLKSQSDVLPLREIYVVSPDDRLASLVRMAVNTPAHAVSGISFSGNVVVGTRIPDMYIYRMYRPPMAAAAP
jgi:hypothetical protein